MGRGCPVLWLGPSGKRESQRDARRGRVLYKPLSLEVHTCTSCAVVVEATRAAGAWRSPSADAIEAHILQTLNLGDPFWKARGRVGRLLRLSRLPRVR